MSDLKTTLRQLSERGTPVGSETLRERVALDLAGGRPPRRVPAGWQVALSAAVFILIVIGGTSLLFGGPEGSMQTSGPGGPEAEETVSTPPTTATTTVPPTTVAPVTTIPLAGDTVVVVPDLYAVESEDELEGIMSELGLEYRIELLVVPEGEREGDGIVASQEPDPHTGVDAGDVITVWLYGDPVVAKYPTPDTGTWTYYNASDGLAADCVTATAASPDGTVWVGCSKGLSRFVDGEWETALEFDIVELAAADDDSLWAVWCTDPCDGTGVRRLVDGAWMHYGIQDTFAIVSGPDGTAAAGPSSPLSFFDGDRWTTIEGGEGTWVAISPDGTVWASGNETGLWKYTGDWTLVSRPFWMSQDEAPGVPAVGAEAIWAAPDGSLWGVGDGLFQYADGDWTTHLEWVRPTDVAFSGDDVWVATAWNGAYRYDGREWTQYTTVNGLLSTELTSITVSADGHIWIGTARHGVARLILEGG